MRCPACEHTISWNWLKSELIEAIDAFECPNCSIELRYIIDEGTYYGALHQAIEIVDEDLNP